VGNLHLIGDEDAYYFWDLERINSPVELGNSSQVLKEDSLLHPNCNSISQPSEIDNDCRYPEFSSNIIPDPVTSFNREIYMILTN
jgi:hypothetical protein